MLDTAEDGNSYQLTPKTCKIANSAPVHQPHLPDVFFHPDDIVELSVVGQETHFVSPIENIDKSVGVVQQDLRKADAQPKGRVTEL